MVVEVRAWLAEVVPAHVVEVPAMLTKEERQYLVWLTHHRYRGLGAVVDLGPWLGASSAALAEGLVRNGRPGFVTAIDLFEWSTFYMSVPGLRLADGADFQPQFRRFTDPWHDRVRSTKGNLLSHQWLGGPIEILFVDAAKSWDLLAAILRDFGPHLIPGVTTIVFQDFSDETTYFLPLVADSIADTLRECAAVAEGTTVAFELLAGADLARAAGLANPELFPLDRAAPILRARADANSGVARARYLSQLCRRSAEDLELAALLTIDREILESHPEFDRDRFPRIHDASGLLVKRGWSALDRGEIGNAADFSRRAIAVAPQHPWVWSLHAAVAVRRLDEPSFRRALDELYHHPGQPDFLMFQAQEHHVRRDWVRAEAFSLATLMSFAHVDSHARWAISILGSAWHEQGFPARCWATLERIPPPATGHREYQELRDRAARATGRMGPRDETGSTTQEHATSRAREQSG